MTRWLPLPRSGLILILIALATAIVIAIFAVNSPGPDPVHAQQNIDDISIDMDEGDGAPPANGVIAAGDRNADVLPDAEGSPIKVCGAAPYNGDGVDDDGDTFVDDGCPGGPAVNGTPEQGLCGNGIDDDPVKPFIGAPVYDGVADDGCPSLGPLTQCIEIIDNDVLDADEDYPDVAFIDVTVGQVGGVGIPPAGAMTAWQYSLNWSPEIMDVIVGAGVGEGIDFLIGAAGAAAPFTNIADPTPLVTPYTHGVADAGPTDSGPGVLQRLLIEGNAPGLASLTLSGISVFDKNSALYNITTVNSAQVAVDQACPTPTDVEVTSVTTTAPATGDAGTPFAVTADVTVTNNGGLDPVLVDTTITLNLPSSPSVCTTTDTNPVIVQNTSVGVAASPVAISQQSWDVTCTGPSDHDFTTTATVAIDPSEPAFDTNSANDALTSTADTTAVTAESDLAVDSVTVSGPASATAGTPFDVDVDAVLTNSALFDVNADVTVSLSQDAGVGPGTDCAFTPVGDQTEDDLTVAASPATTDMPTKTWSVTCTDRSDHRFLADVTIAADQLHVTDSTPGNDTGSGQADVPVFEEADVEVTTVTVTAPATEAIDTAFNVTADVELSNLSGVDPVNVDTTITLNLPSDCTTGDTNPVTDDDRSVSVAGSPVSIPQQSWSVTCTDPSDHVFSVDADAAIDQIHVVDSDDTNNSGSDSDTTAVTAVADLKVVDVTIAGPASNPTAGTAFDVTVDATLHNNGPDAAPADATVTLTLPDDCSVSDNPLTASDIPLPVAADTEMPTQTFSVTCTEDGSHDFSATVVIGAVHVTDGEASNNSGDSGVLAVVVEPVTAPTPTPTPTPTPGPSELPGAGAAPSDDSGGSLLLLIPLGLALAVGMGLLGHRYRRRLNLR